VRTTGGGLRAVIVWTSCKARRIRRAKIQFSEERSCFPKLQSTNKARVIKADLKDLDRTEQALSDFLKIPSIDAEPEAPFSAGKTRRDEPHSPSQIARVCRVRNVAASMVLAECSKDYRLKAGRILGN
jgi:hypothetical protein